jgi:hypothetical protein
MLCEHCRLDPIAHRCEVCSGLYCQDCVGDHDVDCADWLASSDDVALAVVPIARSSLRRWRFTYVGVSAPGLWDWPRLQRRRRRWIQLKLPRAA